MITIPTLKDLEIKHNPNKAEHEFSVFYEKYLEPIRYTAKKILEIGIYHGDSLRMWREFFPNAQIYGVDIDPNFLFSEDRITTALCDQSKEEDILSIVDKFGSDFDLILDDGSHLNRDQQITFQLLFPHIKPGKYYVIEDLHMSFKEQDVEQSSPDTSLAILLHLWITKRLPPGKFLIPERSEYINKNFSFVDIYPNHEKSITGIVGKKKL